MRSYAVGLQKQGICGLCRQRHTCTKDGYPRVFPENTEAMNTYALMKMTGATMAGGGYGDEPNRRVQLWLEIAAHEQATQAAQMRKARDGAASK